MLAFVVRRLIQMIFVLILVSFIAFSLLHIVPGDPAVTMLGEEASQAQIDALRHELWLDRPFIVQYFRWFTNVIQGDFGTSITYREGVAGLVISRLPVTFHLGLLSLIISTLISIPAGVLSAVKRGSLLDSIITVSANVGMAIPSSG